MKRVIRWMRNLGLMIVVFIGGGALLEILLRGFASDNLPIVAKLHAALSGTKPMQTPSYLPAPPYVCGTLNGRIINVPRSYLYLWAEYKEDDADRWTGKRVLPKVGCQHELVSLPMLLTWPDFLPGGGYGKATDLFNRIRMNVKGVKQPTKALKRVLAWKLESHVTGTFSHSESLGLSSAILSREIRGQTMLYWGRKNNVDLVVFSCEWVSISENFITCDGEYTIEEQGLLVKIKFTPEKILEWRKMVTGTEKFITDNYNKELLYGY